MGEAMELSGQVKAALATLAELAQGRSGLEAHLTQLSRVEGLTSERLAQLERQAEAVSDRAGQLLGQAEVELAKTREERGQGLATVDQKIAAAIDAEVGTLREQRSLIDDLKRAATENTTDVAALLGRVERMHQQQGGLLDSTRDLSTRLEQTAAVQHAHADALTRQQDGIDRLDSEHVTTRAEGQEIVASLDALGSVQAQQRVALSEVERLLWAEVRAQRERLGQVEQRVELAKVQAESSQKIAMVAAALALIGLACAVAALAIH